MSDLHEQATRETYQQELARAQELLQASADLLEAYGERLNVFAIRSYLRHSAWLIPGKEEAERLKREGER